MRTFLSLVALALFASACGSGDSAQLAASGETPVPTPGESAPPPTLVNTVPLVAGLPAGMEDAIRATLAAELNVATSTLAFVSVEPRTWPDGCLGLGGPGVACTQALVPGWLVVFRDSAGGEYRYRASATNFTREP
jgi:hypothetical protein